MNVNRRTIVVFLLLFSVIVVFVSPAVDLEPTALRASRHAQALEMALVTAIQVVAGHLTEAVFSILTSVPPLLAHNGNQHVDLNCSRLC